MQDAAFPYLNDLRDWVVEQRLTCLRGMSTSIIASTSRFAVVRTWRISTLVLGSCPEFHFTIRCSLRTRPAVEVKCDRRLFPRHFIYRVPFLSSRCSTGGTNKPSGARCCGY